MAASRFDQVPELLTVKGKTVLSPDAAAIISDVEGRAKALMERLGSVAGTQNIDRIMRLPGTTNIPNKKKIKAGRVARPTRLIRFNGATYSLDAFPAAKASSDKSNAGASTNIAIDALPVSKRIKNLIRGVGDPDHPYASRSEAVIACVIAMVSGGCADDQIEAVFLDPRYPISAHVLEQSNPTDYLARQIAHARNVANDQDVAKLNANYALVIIGDKGAILKTADDDIKLLTISAFELWFANEHVYFADKDGNTKSMPLAKHWLHHKQRRQYEGIVFAPGREVPKHFNLWRGFAVEPKPSDCSNFLAHVIENVCRGDNDLYRGWLDGLRTSCSIQARRSAPHSCFAVSRAPARPRSAQVWARCLASTTCWCPTRAS